MSRALRWWRRHFLGVELAFVVIVWCAAAAYVFRFGGSAALDAMLDQNRASVYASLATAATTLLGLLVASLSVTAGYVASPRLTIVRQSKQFPQVGRIFTQSIGALGLLALASFVSLVFDTEDRGSVVFAIGVLFFFLVAAARVWRSIWIVQRMVTVVFLPAPTREKRQSR